MVVVLTARGTKVKIDMLMSVLVLVVVVVWTLIDVERTMDTLVDVDVVDDVCVRDRVVVLVLLVC